MLGEKPGIKVGLAEGVNGGRGSTSIYGRVVDVITDAFHPKYKEYGESNALNAVLFVEIGTGGTEDTEEGLKLAFSCRNGCCTSCAVKIISGTLQQPEAMGVSQALKDKGYALLCVAKATSDLDVETTFEDEVYDLQFGQYFGRGNTRVAPPWEFEED